MVHKHTKKIAICLIILIEQSNKQRRRAGGEIRDQTRDSRVYICNYNSALRNQRRPMLSIFADGNLAYK